MGKPSMMMKNRADTKIEKDETPKVRFDFVAD